MILPSTSSYLHGRVAEQKSPRMEYCSFLTEPGGSGRCREGQESQSLNLFESCDNYGLSFPILRQVPMALLSFVKNVSREINRKNLTFLIITCLRKYELPLSDNFSHSF